jgi:hypothetical protein
MNGDNGLEKNTEKGLKLINRAAKLGNRMAQDNLAQEIDPNTPEGLEEARYYAEKAADQGAVMSQSLLADMIMNSPEEYNPGEDNEKLFKVLTLASYQGAHMGRFNLGRYYAERSKKLLKEGDEEARNKHVLLSLYWFGKAGETVDWKKDSNGCKSMTFMAFYLNEAMVNIWHPRHGEGNRDSPLPGYSRHVPFYNWALAKGGRHTTEMNWPNPWKSQCANCGTIASQEDTPLKRCARCKSLYYCSERCQVQHWKAGHKDDCCKGQHWIEEFFPDLRKTQNNM